MTLNIHTDITNKLNTFLKDNKVPNIIFHGPSGGGKHDIVRKNIY